MHCKTFIAPVRQALDIWAVSATLALGQLVHSICQSHSAFANTFRDGMARLRISGSGLVLHTRSSIGRFAAQPR